MKEGKNRVQLSTRSCGVIIWSKFGLLSGHCLVQVCFFIFTACQKHYKNRGFSTFCWKKSCARNIQGSLSGPSLRFSHAPNLDQITTPTWTRWWPLKMHCFLIFCFKLPIFTMFSFEIEQKLAKNGPNKKDNLSHFEKHRLLKKKLLLQPPSWPKFGVLFFTCIFA